MYPAFERMKTVHALDRAATVTGQALQNEIALNSCSSTNDKIVYARCSRSALNTREDVCVYRYRVTSPEYGSPGFMCNGDILLRSSTERYLLHYCCSVTRMPNTVNIQSLSGLYPQPAAITSLLRNYVRKTHYNISLSSTYTLKVHA
jgi:hypothetical protein